MSAKDEQQLQIIAQDISEVLHNAMMPYSEHVILDRALPMVEDGLKPVQRRILYSMLELGTTPDKPYRKSARVVGDCLGKYHPHGDSSVYGAMVRMAQTFNMSSTLVDGQGNFGSIDGDSPAAMRYTEVRLQPLAMEMLRDLDKDTVDWSLNFDDTLKEPNTLPGRFPNLLVNGASGIAVGLATNIPPHNITEVINGVCAYIDNPKITLENMMMYIPAPDFPLGGKIVMGDCYEDLKRAYDTGKGKVTVYADAEIEVQNGRKSIVISELPYQVNKAGLLEKIDRLREEKKDIFGNIADIIDESGRKTGMRAVIKLKNGADAKKILVNLFKYTDMRQNFNINMVAIANGKPEQMGLLNMIRYYVNYQKSVVYRRSQYELSQAKAREHILQGIIIAIVNIDEVIKIIKGSSSTNDCKINLRERFGISEKQAQAILEIRLARLTKLEVLSLRQEIAELQEKIEYLQGIVKSDKKQLNIVKKELIEVQKQFKTPRRAEIVGEWRYRERDVNKRDKKEKKGISVKLYGVAKGEEYDPSKSEYIAVDESLTDSVQVETDETEVRAGYIMLTSTGKLKFVSEKSYQSTAKTAAACKQDVPIKVIACTDETMLYMFTNKGNIAPFNTAKLELTNWKGKCTKPNQIALGLLSDEKVVNIFSKGELESHDILTATRNGMLKVSHGSEYIASKNVYQGITFKGEDEVIAVDIKDEGKSIIMVSNEGIVLNMESDVPVQGRRAGGVIGMSLRDGDWVVYADQIDDTGEIIVITDRLYAKRVIAGNIKVMPRNRKGFKIIDLKGKNGSSILCCASVQMPYDIVMIGETNELAVISSDDLPIEELASRGRQIPNIVGTVREAVAYKIGLALDAK